MSDDAANDELVGPALELIRAAQSQAAGVDLSWIDPPPSDKDWTLAPDALRMITQIVKLTGPRHILELGSGLSTRVLARAAAGSHPACSISSIDHDPEYNYGVWAKNNRPEGARVKFHFAPVVVRDFGGKLLGTYLVQRGKLASKRPVDLVIIDGPPVNLGGREATLYQVMEYARPGTIVLLDDSRRMEEKAAIRAWRDNLGDAIYAEQLPGFVKGMAAVVIKKVIRPRELWARRFELTRKEIEAIVPAGQPIVFAGDPWWASEIGLAHPIVPMMEQDGQYWGDPADDAEAVAELKRQVARGARHVGFGWPVGWWIGHYRGLIEELSRRGKKVIENDRITMYEVTATAPQS